ncbi:MAG: hypothetical protein QXF20_03005 [Candidatus Hadarchaeales archaeon]
MHEELLRRVEKLAGEERFSPSFFDGILELLLEIRSRPSLSSDPEIASVLQWMEELSFRLKDSDRGCRSGFLREEWRRIRIYEFRRLKEGLSVLEKRLRERLRGDPPLELGRLVEEMREEGAIRETTWALLLSSPWGKREMERREVKEALLRVLRLFSEFRELRRENRGMEKKDFGAGGAR